jgi:hypothetical protein
MTTDDNQRWDTKDEDGTEPKAKEREGERKGEYTSFCDKLEWLTEIRKTVKKNRGSYLRCTCYIACCLFP